LFVCGAALQRNSTRYATNTLQRNGAKEGDNSNATITFFLFFVLQEKKKKKKAMVALLPSPSSSSSFLCSVRSHKE
jgi:hypothetical protein